MILHTCKKDLNDNASPYLNLTDSMKFDLIAPFSSRMDESRFSENLSVLEWHSDWAREVNAREDLSAHEKERRLLSAKTRFDTSSMILGFQQYCHIILDLFPGAQVYSNYTSQDGLEQFFGQQRAQQGQNNNPTESQYSMFKALFLIRPL